MKPDDIESYIAYLRDKYIYDEASGNLLHRYGSKKIKAGAIAGWAKSSGHTCVQTYFNGKKKQVYAHRAIWMIVYGLFPEIIDHIDGDRTNNRLKNLRAANRSINAQNQRKAQTRSKTGLLGVATDGRGYGYVARIYLDGKRLSLGSYATPEAAHQAYLVAKRQIHKGCTI